MTDTTKEAVERLARTLERTPLYEGIGEESAMPEEAAATLRALLARAERAEAERDGWTQTAARHCQNEEWLRGLLVQIGERFGEAARTSDDGSVQDSVLLLKVPELVDALLAERDALRTRLDAIGVLEQPGALTVNCVRGSLRCTERERIEAERDRMREALKNLNAEIWRNVEAKQIEGTPVEIASLAARAALEGDNDE